MVPHFLQALFAKSASAQVSPAGPGASGKDDWDAQYGQYVQPATAPRQAQPVGHGAGPETRRWLVEMWLETLPSDVRPLRLAEGYEQIAFTIALNWGDQRDLKRYMQQLIFSSENARWCFSAEAFQELLRLDRYIDELREAGYALLSPQSTPRRLSI